MSRSSINIFLLAAFLMLAYGAQFERFSLDQGVARSLDAVATVSKYTFTNYTNTSGIVVNLGDEYLANNSLTSANRTEMLVILYSNVTGFCQNCNEFVNYNNTRNDSWNNNNDARKQTFLSPYYIVDYGYPYTQSVCIGNTSATSPWVLSTPALAYTSYYKNHNSIYLNGPNRNYITNTSLYGFLGLGVGGDAAKNFKGDHPLFSIQLNSTGQGQIIFGVDETLYDKSKTAVTIPVDTNWTVRAQNFSWGPTINNVSPSYPTNVIFDVNFPGIAIPNKIYTDIWVKFSVQFALKLRSYSTYGVDYQNVFNGSLSELPNLNFGLVNGYNLTLPPAAYTRSLGNNLYAILINYVTYVSNRTSNDYVDYVVLGWPVLSYFYTVFEQKKDASPTITLYTAYGTGSSSSTASNSKMGLGIAVLVAVIIVYAFFKNRAAAKLKNELGVELRDGQPY